MATAKVSSEPAVAAKARLSPVTVALLVVAAALLVASTRGPWWSITMWAPQYPDGLTATATLQVIAGDVAEIDELNHYIGMMPLNDAAQFERSIALPLVYGMAVALLASIWARGWLRWALRLPAVIFPAFFLADLKVWLWYAGNHLDPSAALSSTISRFTPTALGWGKVAQFHTYGWVEWGFWLALAAAVMTLLTLVPRRRRAV